MEYKKWPMVGNVQITEYLKKHYEKGLVGGSYLFCGPNNLGKTTVAVFFAQLLLCENKEIITKSFLPCGACASCKKFIVSREKKRIDDEMGEDDAHGDLHFIRKEKDKKNISVEQIRDFVHMLNLSSFGNGYKIGIIKHADSLSSGAANALLKTLEEPKNNTLIILIADDKEMLPKTIVSRCQVLQFRTVPAEQIYNSLLDDHGLQREKARDISRLCLGRPALAVKFHEDEDFYKFYHDKVNTFLEIQISDINRRYSLIENIFGKKASAQETVATSHRVLQIWQGIVRDYQLMILGHPNLIQHVYLQDRLRNLQYGQNIASFTKLSRLLKKSHVLLDANVNPKLVFENIVLNI